MNQHMAPDDKSLNDSVLNPESRGSTPNVDNLNAVDVELYQ